MLEHGVQPADTGYLIEGRNSKLTLGGTWQGALITSESVLENRVLLNILKPKVKLCGLVHKKIWRRVERINTGEDSHSGEASCKPEHHIPEVYPTPSRRLNLPLRSALLKSLPSPEEAFTPVKKKKLGPVYVHLDRRQ